MSSLLQSVWVGGEELERNPSERSGVGSVLADDLDADASFVDVTDSSGVADSSLAKMTIMLRLAG